MADNVEITSDGEVIAEYQGVEDLLMRFDASTVEFPGRTITGAGGSGDSWGDAVDADIVPDGDGTRDLGATGTRFAETYTDALAVTNNITVGGTVDGRDVAADGAVLDTAYTSGGTDVPVADGGTGASTAAGARTNLDVDQAGTDNAPSASATTAGKVELATDAETETGTDTARAVTPANVASAYVKASIATTKGDLWVATAAGTITRLGVGTDTHVLTADSAEASGVKWAAAAGGGGSFTESYLFDTSVDTGWQFAPLPDWSMVLDDYASNTANIWQDADYDYLFPFWVPAGGATLDGVGVKVDTAFTGADNVEIAYGTLNTGQDFTRLAALTTQDWTTTGTKTQTGLSASLSEGLHAVVFNHNASATGGKLHNAFFVPSRSLDSGPFNTTPWCYRWRLSRSNAAIPSSITGPFDQAGSNTGFWHPVMLILTQ
jgi:hypothetical protein